MSTTTTTTSTTSVNPLVHTRQDGVQLVKIQGDKFAIYLDRDDCVRLSNAWVSMGADLWVVLSRFADSGSVESGTMCRQGTPFKDHPMVAIMLDALDTTPMTLGKAKARMLHEAALVHHQLLWEALAIVGAQAPKASKPKQTCKPKARKTRKPKAIQPKPKFAAVGYVPANAPSTPVVASPAARVEVPVQPAVSPSLPTPAALLDTMGMSMSIHEIRVSLLQGIADLNTLPDRTPGDVALGQLYGAALRLSFVQLVHA